MRLDDVIRWARRADDASDAPQLDVPTLSLVLSSLGLAGRAEEALAIVDGEPDPDRDSPLTARQVERVFGRGLIRMWVDQLPAARADLAVAASRPHLSGIPLVALGWLAEAEYRSGGWDDSVVHGELAVSLVTDTDQIWLAAFAHTMATWALAARGDWDRAEGHVKAANHAVTVLGDEASAGYAAMACVHLAFCRADAAGVMEAVAPLLSSPAWQQVQEPGVMAWQTIYAEALVSLGRLDEAGDVLDALEALARPRQRRSAQARAQRARGALAAARGDRDAARAAFTTASAHVDTVAMPFERALIDAAYGRFLRRAGERREAGRRLAAAATTFGSLAATPFVARAQAELAACGLAPTRRSAAARATLTPQQLSVARLVGAGMSNREVAAQLVISVKTVEYHLGHVYAKLGLASRAQLAARLGRGDDLHSG